MTGDTSEAVMRRIGQMSSGAGLGLPWFRAVLDSLDEGVVIYDARGRVLEMNSAAQQIHRLESSDEAGLPGFIDACEVCDMTGDLLPVEKQPLGRVLAGETIFDWPVCDFNFIRVNEAYAGIEGKVPREFRGKNHFDLYPDPENHALFRQVVETKQPYRVLSRPFTYPRNPERGVTYWDWQLTPLLDPSGEVKFLVLNLQDVTRRQAALKNLEEQTRQLRSLAHQLSEAEERERQRLAEILHDDLQQSLAATKLHLGIIAQSVQHDPGAEALMGKLHACIDDAIAKSRSLSHELSPLTLRHRGLLEALVLLADQMKKNHRLTVEVSTDDAAEPKEASVGIFLFRAAQELLFNVVKHARTQSAHLKIAREGKNITLTVSDRGKGFDPEKLRFADDEDPGFGLLNIRERSQWLGGTMFIESRPGRGSRFTLVVPDGDSGASEISSDAEGPALSAGSRQAPSGKEEVKKTPCRKVRVLLVDDHKVMREGLAFLLSRCPDIEVVGQAGNGRKGIEEASRLRPDVVLMDISMPVMNGLEATAQIKSLWPETKVIILSMYGQAQMEQASVEAGADLFLSKTGSLDELVSAICSFNSTRLPSCSAS
jgi:signal transduction histidine kinase/ActR/RegA family two-component response regulator